MTWRAKVLNEIKPSKKEDLEIKRLAKKIASKIKIKDTIIELGGSSAKGTWLKGRHDIDLYIKFNHKTYSNMDISEILKNKLKKAKVLHGSRDYFQIEENNYIVELIPIMDIKKVEEADNITDISPFHKKWVRKNKQYVDDIRLAKAFAKANGIYGAESYIKGFSGYSLEVLTIHYKGFDQLIKNVSKWKRKTIIDTEKHHEKKVELNKAKMDSPLILVDPVQSTRNVTAVLSEEKYNMFIKATKSFLKAKNKENYFILTEFSIDKLKKRKGNLVYLEIEPLEGKKDVIGAKLLKSFEFIKRELENSDFKLNDSGWHWEDTAYLWFLIDPTALSNKVKHYGPPIASKDRLNNFKTKWKGKKIYNEDGMSYILKERHFKEAEHLIFSLAEKEFVSKRINKILHNIIFK
ncbi:MAG: CCA tRNA nucleotidyltransferase [Nanoarchaeota archaeon]|nr:CCA tRNA nucleotidyltransferase [Nanoarchaeota archaeon]